jgi:demethylmenaquinone methyltransferase/2-methoxy-6-polyprenyl-1,4-benzoquinol methylase
MMSQADDMKTNRSVEAGHGAGPSRKEAPQMFDRIADRYDLLNRLLSLRRDVYWRRRLVDFVPEGQNLRLLDLATGTADVALTLCQRCPRITSAIGVDMSETMLQLGQQKVVAASLEERITLKRDDATNLDIDSDSFDCVTIAFGIRNLTDFRAGLSEMHRVLAPGGRLLILEFSIPSNRLVRWFYLPYFQHVLPRIGAVISGDGQAYRYLERTVSSFPHGAEMVRHIEATGFQNVTATPLTFGAVTIYCADKANSDKQKRETRLL